MKAVVRRLFLRGCILISPHIALQLFPKSSEIRRSKSAVFSLSHRYQSQFATRRNVTPMNEASLQVRTWMRQSRRWFLGAGALVVIVFAFLNRRAARAEARCDLRASGCRL